MSLHRDCEFGQGGVKSNGGARDGRYLKRAGISGFEGVFDTWAGALHYPFPDNVAYGIGV